MLPSEIYCLIFPDGEWERAMAGEPLVTPGATECGLWRIARAAGLVGEERTC
jgi:hypothetical protein